MGPHPDLLNQSLREERAGSFHFESTPLVTFIGSVSLILFFRGWVLYDGCCCSCFRIPFWGSSFGNSIPIPLSPEVTSSVEHSALSFASVLLSHSIPNTSQLSPLRPLSSLYIRHELNILTCLLISLIYHPRLGSSKTWIFLTLKIGLCLISSVYSIKYLSDE